MFNKQMWLFKHRDALIEAWELGIDEQGNEITEAEYEDFENRCWKSFEQSQIDGME